MDAVQEALAARPAGGEREAERRRSKQKERRLAQLPVVEEAHVPVGALHEPVRVGNICE